MGGRDYCLAAYLLFDALVVLFVILAGGFQTTLTGYSVAAFCEEKWNCTAWECVNRSHSARGCTDDSLCGTAVNKPLESRHDSSCLPDAREDATSGEVAYKTASNGGETADKAGESGDMASIGSVAVQKTAFCGESQGGDGFGGCQGEYPSRNAQGCADGTCEAEVSFADTAGGEDVPSTQGEQRALDDSPCTSGWPSHQGGVVVINGENYACDLFEVTDASLRPIAEEALDCCISGCGPGCHDFCGSAYRQGLGDIKRCAGLYLIYGLGPARQWMQDYFAAEFACAGDTTLGCSEDDRYTCDCSGRGPSGSAMGLQCTVAAQPWDADMSQNSCYLSDLPAHVNINVLSTGTCVDYSVSLTTLLRLASYGADEVYSVMGAGHEYNLVRFPGEARWNIVDTTENNPRPYNPSGLPHQGYPYCEYHLTSCANDAGQGDCPAKEMVKGCGQ